MFWVKDRGATLYLKWMMFFLAYGVLALAVGMRYEFTQPALQLGLIFICFCNLIVILVSCAMRCIDHKRAQSEGDSDEIEE